nr:WD repeat-containing protein 89 [Onthophagus taurus]
MSVEESCGNYESEEEINRLFNLKTSHIFHKEIDKKCYITDISGSIINSNVAVARSDHVLELYDVSNSNIYLIKSFQTDYDIVDVKISPENERIFYVGTNDCKISVWDSRLKTSVVNIFNDTTVDNDGPSKILSCFDISSNNLLLSGGTELVATDAYILFWDIRQCKLMGAYWESHTEDITQVLFNPNDMNQLISGSNDGLINIYDLSQSCEDDALIDSLNTMLSISKLKWYKDKNTDCICCITQSEDLQFWKMDDANPYKSFNKSDLPFILKGSNKEEDYFYVADVFQNPKNDCINVLIGRDNEETENLGGFRFAKNELVPTYNFIENKQIVRCSWFNHNGNFLITGGEAGALDLWNLEKDDYSNGFSSFR